MLNFVTPFMTDSRVIGIAACIFVSSCSFQSRQLDFLRSTWQDRFSKTSAETSEEVFWWDFIYADTSYRLFPLNLKGSTALTDGKRWIVVLRESKIELIRDLVARRDVKFSFMAYAQQFQPGEWTESRDGCRVVDQQSGDCNTNREFVESVRISSLATGRKSYVKGKEMKCGVSTFDTKQLRQVTLCMDEEGDPVEFNVVEMDEKGVPAKIIQRLNERGRVVLSRSGTRVNEQELREFLKE